MSGHKPGLKLKMIQAVKSADAGLRVARSGALRQEEVDRLLTIHDVEQDSFVPHMTQEIISLASEVQRHENPADAVELALTVGVLVDRMTNRALFSTREVQGAEDMYRTRNGIVIKSTNAETTVIPYRGKEQ